MRTAIERNVPATRSLPPPLAHRLDGLVISFLREKQFVGCNGLEITDEIRATIAAQACLLLLGRPGLYDELQSILVYPGTFWVEDEVHDDDGLVTHRRRELSGEAWDSHRIILSWQDIDETARQPADGYNVVLHEFAHYLDAEGRGLSASGRARTIDAWHRDLVTRIRSAVRSGGSRRGDVPGSVRRGRRRRVLRRRERGVHRVRRRIAGGASAGVLVAQEFYGIDPADWGVR